jgi:ATP-dependent 26S proteasome regulatory subunit
MFDAGELLRQLDEERYIVKASSGPRYVVGCRNKVKRDLLKPGINHYYAWSDAVFLTI